MAEQTNDTPDPRVQAAREFCTAATEFRANQLKRENEDLAFQVPELQWTAEARKRFDGGMINGLFSPPRPILSISKIDQPIQLILNQERAAHLGVQIHPLSEDADKETAERIQDIYRSIERDSFADLARTWAYERGVKAGTGSYRILTEYADEVTEGPGLFDQKIVIKRVLDQRCVLLDPFATEPDWSDGRKGLVYEMVPFDRYKQRYPNSKLANFDAMDFDGLNDELSDGWWTGDDVSRAVRVAEYFYIVEEAVEKSFGGKSRTVYTPTVHWCKVNGIEVLEDAIVPGKYITIIPVIGQELQPFDDERRFFGVISRAKDAQRLLNIEVSNAVNKDALATKVPWLVAEGQEEGHEQEFELSTTRNLAMIRYKPTTVAGQLVERPHRMLESPDLSSSLMLIQQANEYIQATTYTYDPSLGKQSRGNKPAKAILAEQQQSEQGNSNYLDNLARAMRHEARVILGMIPQIYDRPGRRIRGVDAEGNEQEMLINQYFVKGEDGRPVPVEVGEDGKPLNPDAKIIDLRKGVYGVSVTIGKTAKSRLEAGSDALGQLIQSSPEIMMPLIGHMWLSFQDFPGAQEAAKIIKAKFQPEADGEDSPEALKAKMAKMTEMLEMAKQENDAMRQAIETKQVEQQGKVAASQAAEAGKAQLEQMKAELALRETALQGQIDAMLAKLEGAIKLKLQDDQQAHEMAMAGANAAQSQEQADADRQHQANMGRQAHESKALQGKQSHQQAMEQGDRSHLQNVDMLERQPQQEGANE